ncbi:unnamed protein product [Blepharisma stoltei]|uniref:Autophagy-related protein n=1 Tax=Blepharisma stoltei TaxID=1481888 RepID=A0AAU9IU12_9CILI|nr:unnamed protein product [Blepharisma stoltei]
MFRYKEEKTLDERKHETEKIQSRWPEKIPIILEKDSRCTLEALPKSKFLCSNDFTVQQFTASIRKKLNLDKSAGVFIFIGGKELLSGEALMREVYQQKKDEDGFLYMLYSEHEVLG